MVEHLAFNRLSYIIDLYHVRCFRRSTRTGFEFFHLYALADGLHAGLLCVGGHVGIALLLVGTISLLGSLRLDCLRGVLLDGPCLFNGHLLALALCTGSKTGKEVVQRDGLGRVFTEDLAVDLLLDDHVHLHTDTDTGIVSGTLLVIGILCAVVHALDELVDIGGIDLHLLEILLDTLPLVNTEGVTQRVDI